MVRKRKTVVFAMVFAFVICTAGFGFGSGTASNIKVNINTATKTELTQLHQIGPAKADAIIQYRKANGPFKSPSDLTKVSGIGEKIYSMNKDMIVVEMPKEAKEKMGDDKKSTTAAKDATTESKEKKDTGSTY